MISLLNLLTVGIIFLVVKKASTQEIPIANCPEKLNFNPNTLFLPPRYIPFVNASSTDVTPYQVYTPTQPKVDETVVSIKNAELCLPEGAAATFVVKTDVYANIATVPYSVESGRNVWIPKPDTLQKPAIYNIETLLTIRLTRDPISKKIDCDNPGSADLATLSNSIVLTQYLSKSEEGYCDQEKKDSMIPTAHSLEDLVSPIFTETMKELQFELEETSAIILSNALRKGGLCVEMESLDYLFGPLPPSAIENITIPSDPSFKWQQCFTASNYKVCNVQDINVCLLLKEAALTNIRIVESLASSDSLLHIKGIVAIGYLYKDPKNGQDAGYIAYKNVLFSSITHRSTGAIDVGLSYETAQNPLGVNNGSFDVMDDIFSHGFENYFFIETSKLIDTILAQTLADWLSQKLVEANVMTIINTN